jgi:DNA-binding response OmpR family regulator
LRTPQPKRIRRILVVEDDPAVRRLLVKALGGAGYGVREAEDGRRALAELDTAIPDLLLVDIMLPVIDGVSLVQAVKEREDTGRIPVIFLTARSDPQSMADGIEAGARYYVTKPFSIDDLLAKVERALADAGAGSP